MIRPKITNNLILIFCILIFFGCQKEKLTADYLIRNVNVIDVKNGLVLSNKHVAIDGSIISAISEREFYPADSVEIIDGKGKYLIPGLWDMHVHYEAMHHTKGLLFVANGVTGTREMYSWDSKIDSIRKLIKDERNVVTDIYFSGRIIDGPDGRFHRVSNKEEVVQEINRQMGLGVDFFKIYTWLTKDAYFAIAEKSEEYNIPFAGHLPNSISVWEAIEANQKSFEHLCMVVYPCVSNKLDLFNYLRNICNDSIAARQALESFNEELFDSIANALSQSKTWICPTLSIYHYNTKLKDSLSLINHPAIKYFPEYNREEIKRRLRENQYKPLADEWLGLCLSSIEKLHQAGVKILAGTDTPARTHIFPGFSLHKELQLLVEAGLTPADALKTATYNPAVCMDKVGELGEVRERQLASLVLLDDNPLENIKNTTEIKAVFLRGRYFNSEALDDLLLKFKENIDEDNYYW